MSVPILQIAQYCGDSLKDCPIPLLQRLSVEGTREVCRVGRVWRFQVPTILTLPNIVNYDLSAFLPLNSVIEDIILVLVNGFPILPYNDDATTPATDQAPYWGTGLAGGGDQWCQFQNLTFTRALQTQITLQGGYTDLSGAPLDVTLNLIPQIGSSTIPDIVWNEYAEAIEQYVKWKARTGDNKAGWYDPQNGALHEQKWLEWSANLRTKARTGNVTPRMRVTPGDFQ